nr:negative transcriptional regulator, NmrA family protein [Polaromonas sp.]
MNIAAAIVQPGTFMDLLMLPGMGLDQGSFSFFLRPGQSAQFIAEQDIGKNRWHRLRGYRCFGSRTIEIAGDELTGPDMQRALSDAAGRPIAYRGGTGSHHFGLSHFQEVDACLPLWNFHTRQFGNGSGAFPLSCHCRPARHIANPWCVLWHWIGVGCGIGAERKAGSCHCIHVLWTDRCQLGGRACRYVAGSAVLLAGDVLYHHRDWRCHRDCSADTDSCDTEAEGPAYWPRVRRIWQSQSLAGHGHHRSWSCCLLHIYHVHCPHDDRGRRLFRELHHLAADGDRLRPVRWELARGPLCGPGLDADAVRHFAGSSHRAFCFPFRGQQPSSIRSVHLSNGSIWFCNSPADPKAGDGQSQGCGRTYARLGGQHRPVQPGQRTRSLAGWLGYCPRLWLQFTKLDRWADFAWCIGLGNCLRLARSVQLGNANESDAIAMRSSGATASGDALNRLMKAVRLNISVATTG